MLLIYLLVAAAIPLLFLTRMQGAIYLFAVVFGIGLGGEYMVIPLMAAELFGVRVLGRAMGVVLTGDGVARSEEHTSELQSLAYLVCRLLLEKKKKKQTQSRQTTHTPSTAATAPTAHRPRAP